MDVIFENKGVIDLHAVTTIGVSVKESENPIGFFGTGLKYAIAIILRNGGELYVQAGDTTHKFDVESQTIRGKEFSIITMNGNKLGFTTHLGINWKLWMAFRELYCNALDEGGTVYTGIMPPAEKGKTRVIVRNLPEFMDCFAKKDSIVLNSKPFYFTPQVALHKGNEAGLYYRGVKVRGVLSYYQYNFLQKLKLTEDRTLAVSDSTLLMMLAEAILQSNDSKLIERILKAPEGYFENDLYFYTHYCNPTRAFIQVVLENKQNFTNFNRSAVNKVQEYLDETLVPEPTELTQVEQKQLQKALAIVRDLHYNVDEKTIVCVDSLGNGVYGLAKDKTIYLAKKAFDCGTKFVVTTLLEEVIHQTMELHDYTRAFQDHLLEKVVSLYEEQIGEPV